MIEYRKFGPERIEEACRIYEEIGWRSYLGDMDKLISAFERSDLIIGAFDDEYLVGFVRCICDGEYILFVQDLIVRTAYRRQGIGKALMEKAAEAYPDVKRIALITDADDKVSNAFYQAIGMIGDCNGSPVTHYFRERGNR